MQGKTEYSKRLQNHPEGITLISMGIREVSCQS
jgi:hypothetical protein